MRRCTGAFALIVLAGAACAEDIITLPTRPGVTQSYLLSAPDKGKARAVAILFAGGQGKVDLERETARTSFDRGNFLVRSRPLFVRSGIAVAVVLNVLNPSVVVLAGGVAGAFDLFEPHVRRSVAKHAFAQTAADASIELSRLGNEAAVVGAAMLAHASRAPRRTRRAGGRSGSRPA